MGQNWSKQGQNWVKSSQMSLGTPAFQWKKPRNRGKCFDKKWLHGGMPNFLDLFPEHPIQNAKIGKEQKGLHKRGVHDQDNLEILTFLWIPLLWIPLLVLLEKKQGKSQNEKNKDIQKGKD